MKDYRNLSRILKASKRLKIIAPRCIFNLNSSSLMSRFVAVISRSFSLISLIIFTISSACSSVNFLLIRRFTKKCVSTICIFKPKTIFIVTTTFLILQANLSFAKTCTGRMINPITDICWECMFPITIGAIPIVQGTRADTINPPSPVCVCPGKIAGLPQVGMTIGLWEGIRLIDVTKAPFCFVNLGGVEIGAGLFGVGSGKDPQSNGDASSATWHAHMYYYPIGFILQTVLDLMCLAVSTFDIGWITEIDPLWQDDQLTFIINPEAILFNNLITQAACAADCVASSVYTALDPLFWCSGCQGSMYPLNGRVQHHVNSLQSSLLTTSRVLYKMHRQLMLPITSGVEGMCQPIPAPIIKKSQYRTQMINPIPAPDTFFGCQPLGKSSLIYEMGREFPIKGEDFGYMIWRKRNCCLL